MSFELHSMFHMLIISSCEALGVTEMEFSAYKEQLFSKLSAIIFSAYKTHF